VIGLDAPPTRCLTSAKSGIGIEEVLEAIVTRIPPPKGDRDAPLKAMLVDSWYDPYLGVVILIRVIDGVHRKGQEIVFMAAGTRHLIDRVGCMNPKLQLLPELGPGEIGIITAQIKEVAQTRVGDTITDARKRTAEPLPGFKEVQPVVFCGLFPVDAADFEKLRESISKLRLNDASFSFETESSAALGFGFRCGFLGLLHLEIIQERLTREYDLDLITTAPSVVYTMHLTHSKNEDAQTIQLHNPADMPDPNRIESIEEPWIEATIYVPDEYLGPILKLCQDRRGIQKNLTYVGGRAQLTYELPLNEVVFDFYDRLKSMSKGYASFDYHQIGTREGDLVKMSILGQRGAGRRPVHDRPPRHRRTARPRHGRAPQGADPEAHVQDPDPGRDRRQGHRPRDASAPAQGRDRQMLRRRRHRKRKLLEKQKEGQGADAGIWQRQHPAGGVHSRR
jgi:GTP-binding protein LepA